MSLYRRANSPYWWIRFQLDGREVRASTGTEDREQAEELERHARDSVWRQVKLGEKPPYLWTDARKRWLVETRKRTRAKDEEILSWFDKHLKRHTMQDITRPVVEHLRVLRAEESSKATADRYMALLRAVLRKCVNDWQVLATAPKVSMYRTKSPEARWLTQPQFEKLCEKLPEHLALAARFAVTTGLRMRSMTALTWDRVDMKNRRLWIPGEQMKTGIPHGIPLSRKAIRLLRKVKKLNPNGEHVFQWKGKPIDDCNTQAFQDAVKAANLQPLRWHDLRHTFASWAIQNGVTLPELMQLGGWKSYSMVQKYAHPAPEHLAAAAEKASAGRHKNRHTRSTQT
jgi:integrase